MTRSLSRCSENRRKFIVNVVEQGMETKRSVIKCELNKNVKFDSKNLESYCNANWNDRVFDALVVAGAVQFCDHSKQRSNVRWGREFFLKIPVHDVTHWNSTPVLSSLTDALEFVTGDQWNIEFIARSRKEPQPQMQRNELQIENPLIIPYSDGWDSFAVAGMKEQEYGGRLFRVRLLSQSVGKARGNRNSKPFAGVPLVVKYGNVGSVESSSRSRGFKIAMLSGIAAFLSKARIVIMPESGIGILGSSLVPVGQLYEDYRNHPFFTDRMTVFFTALFDWKIRFSYPRLWHTKAETGSAFIERCFDWKGLAETRSCWRDARHASVSGHLRHCGVCLACLLRRMSVHSVGRFEKIRKYVWENLDSEEFESGASSDFRFAGRRDSYFKYAVAGINHLEALARLTSSEINRASIKRAAFNLSTSLGLEESVVRSKLHRLLTAHREEWDGFLTSLGRQSFVANLSREGRIL